MKTRPQDERLSRYIGPADRAQGEWRGHRVVVLDEIADSSWRVRFPDGTVSTVHDDHLTLPFVRRGDAA